jgi:flavin-dependent dehydrogenase
LIGNAAAEAHPIVGEGIAMALQSAGLLARPLGRALAAGYSGACERAVATAYARDWQRLAARRLRASAALARLAMSPIAVVLAEQLLRRAPRILTQAARMSGKSPRGVIVPGA